MNRRTVLQSAGALGAIGIAGCLGDAGVESPVPIEVYNDADRTFNVQLEAHERGMDRQTYDESIAMTPGERAIPGRLERGEQRFRVVRHGDDEYDDLVETGTITSETQLVVVRVYDDSLELEIDDGDGDGDARNETRRNGGNETDATSDDADE